MALMPEIIISVITWKIYIFIFYIFRYRRKLVYTHLKNSFPEKNEIEIYQIQKQYYKYLASLFPEIIRLEYLPLKKVEEKISVTGWEHVEAGFKAGKKVYFFAGHYGNWEWAGMYLGSLCKEKVYVVYKPLSNPYFENWFMKMRHRTGNQMISMYFMARQLILDKNPSLIFILADQTPSGREGNFIINFLNRETVFFSGVEKIIHKTDGVAVFGYLFKKNNGKYQVEIIPVSTENKSEGELTREYVRILEQYIRKYPWNWIWSHRRWKHSKD